MRLKKYVPYLGVVCIFSLSAPLLTNNLFTINTVNEKETLNNNSTRATNLEKNLNSQNVNFEFGNTFTSTYGEGFSLGVNRLQSGTGQGWCNFYVGLFKENNQYIVKSFANYSSDSSRMFSNYWEVDSNFNNNYKTNSNFTSDGKNGYFINRYDSQGEIDDSSYAASMKHNNGVAYYLASPKNTQNENPNVGSTKTEVLYDSLSLSEGQSITVGLKVRGNNSFYTGIRANKNSNIESSLQNRWTTSSDENNLSSVNGISTDKTISASNFSEAAVYTYAMYGGQIQVSSGTTNLDNTTASMSINEDKTNITASGFISSKTNSELESLLTVRMDNGYLGSKYDTSTFRVRANDQEGRIYLDFCPKTILKNGGVEKNSSMKSIVIAEGFSRSTIISTNIKNNGIQVDSSLSSYSPYEIENSLGKQNNNNIYTTVLKFIYKNLNEIFDNYPTNNGISESNISEYFSMNDSNSYEFIESTSTSITFKFSAKSLMRDGSIDNSWNSKAFTLKLIGLANKDTQYKNGIPTMTVRGTSLEGLTGYKIVDAINSSSSNSITNGIIEEIYNNRKNYFSNISLWENKSPEECINILSPYSNVVEKGSNNLIISFSVKNIYKDGEVKNNWVNSEFSINIIGLKDNKTSIQETVNVNNFFDGTDIGNISSVELKQYIIDNDIIENLPSSISDNDISIEIIDIDYSSNTISTNIKLSKYYNENGDLITNGNNLSFPVNFVVSRNVSSSNVDNDPLKNMYWIWIVIGIVILILLIIILIIILKKKEKNKVNSKKISRNTQLSYNQIPSNRLQLNNPPKKKSSLPVNNLQQKSTHPNQNAFEKKYSNNRQMNHNQIHVKHVNYKPKQNKK